ncbi:MAG: ABC transporter ATP-binding protein [Anaerolineales bacterium]|nr:ABC transporter ATP-binding protein [Anaerolineales bacterium]
MNKETVLQVNDLKKHFGQVRAVDGVNLSVMRGQIFGFLGPNGSGKTTTIGMILGLIHPTQGRVNLFGRPVSPSQTEPLRKVGALVGAPSLVPYLSARQNLELIARLCPDMPAGRIGEILEIVDLTSAADRKAGKFSTGMKQRLGLGMAILHKPELLILDEPTNGMDPAGMHEVRNLLARLSEEGVTVFLSSHLLYEAEQICDQVAVIKQGRVIAEGMVKDFIGQKALVRVRVPSTNQAVRILQAMPDSRDIRANGSYVTVSGVASQAVVAHLASNGVVPSEVTNGHQDLESIFLELTESKSKEM